MPLKLYQITDTTTGEAVLDAYFQDMYHARLKRDELNKTAGETLRYVVSDGPDHKKTTSKRATHG